MCGRYTLTRQEAIVEELQATLGPNVLGSEWWKPRFNVAPTQPSPVVTLHDGVRTIEMMRWGLVPFWATKPGAARPPLMINARVESLHAKQWFREALDKRRCLVPADGFFEWKRDDPKHPMPIYLRPDSRKIIAFAGLWAKAKTADGNEQLSFTIITSAPNELVKPVHDRMPLVLDESAYAAWLDPTVTGEGARALLTIPPVGDWHGVPVSPHVNKATNDDPRCVEPLEVGAAKQLSLL
ncbi:MAG: SOS response-associated peptidase [Deltaproteobacteria bacterium]|nr:SOS response-associated peptidase [Deltaproteobacteria bacterium]